VAQLLRRIQRVAQAQPVLAIVSVLIFVGATVGSAVAVGSSGNNGESSQPPVNTTAPTTTLPTTTSPSTTAAPTTSTPPTTTGASAASGQRCLVRLHGKGGGYAPPYVDDHGVVVLTPNGNADGWGGRQWLYFPDSRYREARAVVQKAIDDAGCGRVIINGFSNGGAFSAKLYCQGETFDNRLVGVVVDDPVPDAGVDGCSPASGVRVTLYWTGALDPNAGPGWNCKDADWTCEGGKTIGLDNYENDLGSSAKQSPYSDHKWYQGAPELNVW
jgi:hypothetical protein